MEIMPRSELRTLKRVDHPQAFSYREINQEAHAIASRLQNQFGSGKRIALLMEPGPDFVAAFVGSILSGSCVVVLSPLHTDAESTYYCADSDAVALICSESYRDRAARLIASLKSSIDEREIAVISFNEIEKTPTEVKARPSADSPALQLYTSGTTGKPKGVVLTLENLTHQQKLLREAWGLTESDTLLHTLPLHHMHGLCISLLSSLSAGTSITFVPHFSPQLVWDQMGSSTVYMAVPTIYAKLFQAFDEADIETQARWRENARHLRLATSGSAALPVTLARRWKELTGNIPLERFGMSEIGVGLSNPLHGKRVEGHVGHPLPTVETRIIDGELWISGPSVFKEYYKRPEATAEVFAMIEGRRFFRTGDTVEITEDGFFRILGRTSVDILKSGGYKLSALEIEEAIRENAAIADVAVIGLPDPVWGDRVSACVVCRPGQSLSPEALRSFLKERLAPYKVPKEVFFLSELPKNAMGKVVKPELKKKFGSISS